MFTKNIHGILLRMLPLHDPPSQSSLQFRLRRVRPSRQLPPHGKQRGRRDSEAVEGRGNGEGGAADGKGGGAEAVAGDIPECGAEEEED